MEETAEGPSWRPFIRDALRPETGTDRPSPRALTADAVLALALGVCAVIALGHLDVGRQVVGVLAPGLPTPPGVPPQPPGLVTVSLSPEPQQYLAAVLGTLPLVARRRFPLAAFWVVMVAAMSQPAWATGFTLAACTVAAYSAVVYSRNLVPVMGGFALAGVLASYAFREAASATAWPGSFDAMLVLALVGSIARYWQLRLKASQQRMAELEQAQQEAMRKAVEEERSRIAAELHDVVTHNVAVMVIQAGAARKVMDQAPEMAKEALLAVEAGGRAAMAELRHAMGLLAASGTGRSTAAGTGDGRPDGAGDELEPQPGLDQLTSLVERIRAAGLPVSIALSPPPGPLPPGVELTAYRVVQEALTNSLKHASGARACVTIGHQGDWLEIEVTDTGGTSGAQAGTGNGRGLIGMRERLAVYGGTLDAGRRIGGGYLIKARVPWRTV